MEQAHPHSAQRVDLLGHDRQESRNKDIAHRADDRRSSGREATALLLARLSAPKAKGKEMV